MTTCDEIKQLLSAKIQAYEQKTEGTIQNLILKSDQEKIKVAQLDLSKQAKKN